MLSEREPRAELDAPRAVASRRSGCRTLSGSSAHRWCSRTSRSVFDAGPLVGVERVVELDAELQPARAADRDVLEQRDVPVHEARSLVLVVERVAEADSCRVGGAMHSVLNWRSNVRSPRGRFGSHRMSTRLPPPLIAPVPLSAPVGTFGVAVAEALLVAAQDRA